MAVVVNVSHDVMMLRCFSEIVSLYLGNSRRVLSIEVSHSVIFDTLDGIIHISSSQDY